MKFEGQSYLRVCDDAHGPDDAVAREVASQLRLLIGGDLESAVSEYPCHSPDEERWFRVQLTRFQVEGRVRVVVAHQNVTLQRKAEAERLELTRQLFQSQQLESLGSLAGGIAHDINNVLAAISNAASAHRPKTSRADPLTRAMDTITNACLRGRSVIKSLLYFAREEIGSRGPVDLNVVAREIVELLDQTTLKRIAVTTPETGARRGDLCPQPKRCLTCRWIGLHPLICRVIPWAARRARSSTRLLGGSPV